MIKTLNLSNETIVALTGYWPNEAEILGHNLRYEIIDVFFSFFLILIKIKHAPKINDIVSIWW